MCRLHEGCEFETVFKKPRKSHAPQDRKKLTGGWPQEDDEDWSEKRGGKGQSTLNHKGSGKAGGEAVGGKRGEGAGRMPSEIKKRTSDASPPIGKE